MASIHHNADLGGNKKMLRWLVGIPTVMLALSFASVPLYNIFCSVTGYGGTTQVAEENAKGVIAREMAVRFDSTIDRGIPLRVVPASVETNAIGTISTVTYRATNLSDEPLRTTASFNVTPENTGIYFNKIECFCFTEQVLAPNETVEMPVTYFIDPDLDENSELRTIRQITLSYTFHDS
ncbi:MAG TPA: cytochrome c oxidase assembly protein [Hyphomonas sp.]|jgi:cytochrome c oxidase assembly protein subunit 11|uniref:Cytochrome c oxidase assembly protein CtaG n=1 Tax=Pelagibacterium nitratireducens TaxID=1046114 RepID=A0ABZ2I3H3_9HYPH|nr:cytochrome c oxidase assembly protein [Pelagibacterium sp.]HCE24995.1 cytochrome c oxidase assembly protein [Hyphomonas sp.]HCO54566.1 cytochrome c oxidase assembly protein [Pelagibacterium sp.]|tara:strand:- start:113 stop:652 length:540 start_codon:yes stop_codon:yes gene_type:complete